MSNNDDTPQGWGDDRGERLINAPTEEAKSNHMLGLFARGLARLWVVCLMLVAAGVAGAAFFHMQISERRLADEKDVAKAGPWAVVTYRDELQEIVRKMEAEEIDDSVLPTPPLMPPLQKQIDRLEDQNAALRKEIADRVKARTAVDNRRLPGRAGRPGEEAGLAPRGGRPGQ